MIARKSALIVATNLLNGVLGYVALFFITRYIGPHDYGLVAFALGFVSLFSIFGNLGFTHAHIKKISEGKDLGTCIGTFLATKIGLIGLMMSITLGAILFWKVIMGRGFESSTHELAIYIMMGYSTINLLAHSFEATFKAKKQIAKSSIPLFFETLVRVAVTIYVALAGFGAIALSLTYVAGGIALFLSSLYFFRGLPVKKPSRDCFNDYSKFAFPLVIIKFCGVVISNIDKLLIQLFWSASIVGYYAAAFRLSMFINMFTMAIGTLLFPIFSTLHANNDIKEIHRLTLRSERYLSMIVFPMVFGMVVLAEPAAFILLSGWMPAVPILQILPFFVLFAALERPYQSQFLGMNRPKIARNRVLIVVCFNVFLNIILIPKDIQAFNLNLAGMGARGAAIATVVSYAIGLIYSRVMSWRLTKIKGNPRILIHAFAAGVMAVILYMLLYDLNVIVFITRWYHLLGFSLLSLVIYMAVLSVMKEFTKQDFHFFMDTLNIKKMVRYIRKEIREK